MRARHAVVLMLMVSVFLVACASTDEPVRPSTDVSTRPAGTSTMLEAPVALPGTPAGRQLRWVLDNAAQLADATYAERFTTTFIAKVPMAAVRSGFAENPVTAVKEVLSSTDTELSVRVATAAQPLILTINVEAAAPHLIAGLLAQPLAPDTWRDIEVALGQAGPDTAFWAAEVTSGALLRTVRSSGDPDEARPLGSAFKLYVLGALVDAVESGDIAWEETLTINSALKSLPSGELQDRPDGSTVTVREAAEKMIQISDNTATDLLIKRLGSERVEALLSVMGMGTDSRDQTLPFLTTRQLFTLKYGAERSVLEQYAGADVTTRRQLLNVLPAELPGAAQFDAQIPRAIDRVEWFATPAEVAAAHLWLDAYRERPGFEPLLGILGANPGVPLNTATWSSVSFKGGSETGVFFLSWLLHRRDGRRFVVVLSATDQAKPVNELPAVAAARGIIAMLSELP